MAKDRIKLERPTIERTQTKAKRLQRAPKGMQLPRFEAMFDPEADELDPLNDLEMTGDQEQDATAEYDSIERDFLNNVKVENDPYRIATDPEFFFVVCFQSREQKDEFLEKSGILRAVGNDKYIDGLKLAEHLEVDVQPIALPKFKNKKTPRLLRDARIIR